MGSISHSQDREKDRDREKDEEGGFSIIDSHGISLPPNNRSELSTSQIHENQIKNNNELKSNVESVQETNCDKKFDGNSSLKETSQRLTERSFTKPKTHDTGNVFFGSENYANNRNYGNNGNYDVDDDDIDDDTISENTSILSDKYLKTRLQYYEKQREKIVELSRSKQLNIGNMESEDCMNNDNSEKEESVKSVSHISNNGDIKVNEKAGHTVIKDVKEEKEVINTNKKTQDKEEIIKIKSDLLETKNKIHTFENIRNEQQKEKNLLLQITEEINVSAKITETKQEKRNIDMVRKAKEEKVEENEMMIVNVTEKEEELRNEVEGEEEKSRIRRSIREEEGKNRVFLERREAFQLKDRRSRKLKIEEEKRKNLDEKEKEELKRIELREKMEREKEMEVVMEKERRSLREEKKEREEKEGEEEEEMRRVKLRVKEEEEKEKIYDDNDEEKGGVVDEEYEYAEEWDKRRRSRNEKERCSDIAFNKIFSSNAIKSELKLQSKFVTLGKVNDTGFPAENNGGAVKSTSNTMLKHEQEQKKEKCTKKEENKDLSYRDYLSSNIMKSDQIRRSEEKEVKKVDKEIYFDDNQNSGGGIVFQKNVDENKNKKFKTLFENKSYNKEMNSSNNNSNVDNIDNIDNKIEIDMYKNEKDELKKLMIEIEKRTKEIEEKLPKIQQITQIYCKLDLKSSKSKDKKEGKSNHFTEKEENDNLMLEIKKKEIEKNELIKLIQKREENALQYLNEKKRVKDLKILSKSRKSYGNAFSRNMEETDSDYLRYFSEIREEGNNAENVRKVEISYAIGEEKGTETERRRERDAKIRIEKKKETGREVENENKNVKETERERERGKGRGTEERLEVELNDVGAIVQLLHKKVLEKMRKQTQLNFSKLSNK